MTLALLIARSSLPNFQTMCVIAGIIAVIGGIFYSRMSMS